MQPQSVEEDDEARAARLRHNMRRSASQCLLDERLESGAASERLLVELPTPAGIVYLHMSELSAQSNAMNGAASERERKRRPSLEFSWSKDSKPRPQSWMTVGGFQKKRPLAASKQRLRRPSQTTERELSGGAPGSSETSLADRSRIAEVCLARAPMRD